VISVVTALGLDDLLEVQVNAVLQNEELTEDELREMAVFLTHYVGFPLGSRLNGAIERVTAQRKNTAPDKKANVNTAVQMHTGKTLDE
jgi:4-carboxymuconolactone decarboxylase